MKKSFIVTVEEDKSFFDPKRPERRAEYQTVQDYLTAAIEGFCCIHTVTVKPVEADE